MAWYDFTAPDPFISELSWDGYSEAAKANMVNVNGKGIIRYYDQYFLELRDAINNREEYYGLSLTSWTNLPYNSDKPYIWDIYMEEIRTAATTLCPYLSGKTYDNVLQEAYGYSNWCNGETLTNNYIFDRCIEEIRHILILEFWIPLSPSSSSQFRNYVKYYNYEEAKQIYIDQLSESPECYHSGNLIRMRWRIAEDGGFYYLEGIRSFISYFWEEPDTIVTAARLKIIPEESEFPVFNEDFNLEIWTWKTPSPPCPTSWDLTYASLIATLNKNEFTIGEPTYVHFDPNYVETDGHTYFVLCIKEERILNWWPQPEPRKAIGSSLETQGSPHGIALEVQY